MYSLLIVDDEPIVRTGIKNLIDYDSLNITQVLEAVNGLQALEAVKSNSIDIVLADINMPKMNGLDFARSAKQHNKDIIIVLVTGYDYFDYAVSALRYGVDEYLLKPVSKSDIEKVLRQMIEKIEDRKVKSEIESIAKDSDNEAGTDGEYKAQIEEIIENKLAESDFSLSVLSGEINLSTGYLSRIIKQYFGVPFRDYVMKLRIDKAKILLLSSNMKIYEISESLGFEDPNYFSAMFKKATGYSPNGYRKHIKND
ncbi:MAG: response regulator [Clostridia bacterium]|nr:response regulator [Clostridia bacterium]